MALASAALELAILRALPTLVFFDIHETLAMTLAVPMTTAGAVDIHLGQITGLDIADNILDLTGIAGIELYPAFL